MANFDSPIERCEVCGEYVLLDQIQEECAREHGCGRSVDCPLKRYFDGPTHKPEKHKSEKAN